MSERASTSFGQQRTTWVDRFGVWLSRRAIERALPPRFDLELLELGCGYRATHLQALRTRCAHATGVDFHIAPELRSAEWLTLYECAIEEVLPQLEHGRFDAILLISVLEHLAQPQEVLTALHERLRPGGVLLINVPTWRGKFFLEWSAFRLGWSPKVEMDDHKMYYDPRDLWPLLVRAGFRPSELRLRRHKFGLNLFATARRRPDEPR